MNTKVSTKDIEEKIEGMSVEDLVGQLLCFQINTAKPIEEFEKMAKRIRPGGIFFRRKRYKRNDSGIYRYS